MRTRWRVAAAAGGTALAVVAAGLMGVPAQADTAPTSAGVTNKVHVSTPIMGFNDWNAFGCDVSAALIEKTADKIVSSGMKAAGYTYVNIDDCWMTKTRSSTGHLVADPAKFPDGIKAVADYVHSKGLKLGIYESAGETTCQQYPGSLGHEQTDADDFAAWGVDLLKYDNCGTTAETSSTKAQYVARYSAMADALANSGREIVYSVCEWGVYEPWTWADDFSTQWRTTNDISDNYGSMLGIVAQNSKLWKSARSGAWNDPDMLEVGNGGMTNTEYRSEFSLWSIMAAPLIAGTDLTKASAATLAIYTNKDVIAVDQDALGKQGRLLTSKGGLYVIAKPLKNGDVAVALFNSTDTAKTISTTTAAAGAKKGSTYTLKDLWSKSKTETSGRIEAFVPAHGTTIYRVHSLKGASAASAVAKVASHTVLSVSTPTTDVVAGSRTSATVTVRNDGRSTIVARDIRLSAPKGWKVSGSPKSVRLKAGQTTKVRFGLRAPKATKPIATAKLRATAHITGVSGARTLRSTLGAPVVSPLSKAYRTANTTGARATLGEHHGTIAIRAAGDGVAAAQTGFITSDAADEYAAAVRTRSVTGTSTVTATVVSHDDPSSFGSSSSTGIMVRNDAKGSGPEGVVLSVSSSNVVQLAYAKNGGETVDTTIGGGFGATGEKLPVTLRLTRSGTTYVGQYSTNGGSTWTTVGTVTLPASASASVQDAAVFHASGSAAATEADFSGFTVR